MTYEEVKAAWNEWLEAVEEVKKTRYAVYYADWKAEDEAFYQGLLDSAWLAEAQAAKKARAADKAFDEICADWKKPIQRMNKMTNEVPTLDEPITRVTQARERMEERSRAWLENPEAKAALLVENQRITYKKDNVMTPEILQRFSQEPGLLTREHCQEVQVFLTEFQNMLVMYRAAFGEPLGFSVQQAMDKAQWYINYHTPHANKDNAS